MRGSRFTLAFVAGFLATAATLLLFGLGLTALTVAPPPERFRAGSFDFALAPGWTCERQGTEFVCNPPGGQPYAATVIMAVKERGRDDTLDAYEQHLREPSPPAKGSTKPAEIVRVGRRQFGKRIWVEGVQTGSEVPNYDTYYLATTTSLLGILVTMSVHKDHRAAMVGDLDRMIGSLNAYQE